MMAPGSESESALLWNGSSFLSLLQRHARQIYRLNPWTTFTGWAHLILFLAFGAAALLDARTVDALNTWFKPMKFAISISVFAFTLSFLTAPLLRVYGGTLDVFKPQRSDLLDGSGVSRTSGPGRIMLYSRVICLMLWGEIILIAFQAARGERSHFNVESPLGGIIYGVMGLMILTSTIATIAFLLPYFRRSPEEFGLSRSTLSGIRMGSVLFLLGSVAGGIMSSLLTHSVGDPGLNRIPFLGWSATAGDIRAVHFFGLHGIQILPLAGWLSHRLGWPAILFRGILFVFSGMFFAVTALTALGLSVVYWWPLS
ncbi:MAG: hypothetical protein KDK23_09505 [Leptospiraceae bacterium]|nr:hypothetical protein [Leptospiraceae bacterium]